ncbi:hypothetical protein O9H85_28270 [Paenibacillus filicis]|uniref:Uncharacterized protein n=1 Tax=Paenibacillus gyeongsangnamensis TaxID=3388067 RepID=A0ABT4QH88_9BACL|nr:hypothetical protein [Paenibacillus filicis]MCZ8516221.1 hypothetical protein [Paenibacillus filicis]
MPQEPVETGSCGTFLAFAMPGLRHGSDGVLIEAASGHLQVALHVLQLAVGNEPKLHRPGGLKQVRLQRRTAAAEDVEALEVRAFLPALLDQVRDALGGPAEIVVDDRLNIGLAFPDAPDRIIALLDPLAQLDPAGEGVAVLVLDLAPVRA